MKWRERSTGFWRSGLVKGDKMNEGEGKEHWFLEIYNW